MFVWTMDLEKNGQSGFIFNINEAFKEFIQWCCEPQRLFVLFIVVLAIPNVALFFTEQQMTLWARICNVILPVSVYWLIMTLGA